MLMSTQPEDGSTNLTNQSSEPQPSSADPPDEIRIPKNKSTGSLVSQAAPTKKVIDTGRHRMSIDAGLERMTRSPIVPEHEHGLGTSGLRRIRQPPSLRINPGMSSQGPMSSTISRSSSMNFSLPPTRNPSVSLPSGPTSPALAFGEDLMRFPAESLHSFSFAHQGEDLLHSRQNILKRSIEFMRDKLGWAGSSPAIAAAQAKISGDREVQSMLELLTRANLIGQDADKAHGLGGFGPITGPPDTSGENIFEKNFLTMSPTTFEEPQSHARDLENQPNPTARSVQDFAKENLRPEAQSAPESTSVKAIEESLETPKASPPTARRATLKRTLTDVAGVSLQNQLHEALAQPYIARDLNVKEIIPLQPEQQMPSIPPMTGVAGSSSHVHGSRWAPAAQAIFTTEAQSPWTITAANDLACLVFGVKRAEVRKLGILEVVRPERRKWLEERLRYSDAPSSKSSNQGQQGSSNPAPTLAVGNGVTAKLLSKPPSRYSAASAKWRSKTDDGSGSSYAQRNQKANPHHQPNKSRGVLLCGDVVPIQKRNGALGSASLWVKEKKGGLIWVLEEIAEDEAHVSVDEIGCVTRGSGATETIWGMERIRGGMDIQKLIPSLPRLEGTNTGILDYEKIASLKHFTARTVNSINIPISVHQLLNESTFRISSFPHIAGIIVLSSTTLNVTSSNTVFSSALFGQDQPSELHVNALIPDFDKTLRVMTDEDKIELVDGIVIPEHSFRRARALLALREGHGDAATMFLRPSGLPARHRDGSEIMVDVQMRVVKSEKAPKYEENAIVEKSEDEEDSGSENAPELVYALWVTYSRHLHATNHGIGPVTPLMSRPGTPPPHHQPSPGQSVEAVSPEEVDSDDSTSKPETPPASLLTKQLAEAGLTKGSTEADSAINMKEPESQDPAAKKTIDDFVVLEDMGQGAYGQVKLCRYKKISSKKVVIKYVTKRRILVDTWTRDRRLGTVPLEVHVLDYLRRDGLRHANIVEMADFFEDDVNYYIEMIPHGLPGMDLFDYIELRVNMDEQECKTIFVQVAEAIHHLHTKAKVVHRDIKDENVILDGEGNIKLIDFGSAAYIKNGPFDVFVGTIDYAAPEVLRGQSYRGKEQDVWALGILLYTIVYKENPFYSIDEIMDHDLRVPYIMSDDNIDLIRRMLNRDVEERWSIGMVLEHPWCKLVDVAGSS